MGHFGRPPISRAWFFVVFPALTLNYMGQGVADPRATRARSPTRSSCCCPQWARMPMVVLATVATLIASQAVISGAFSVTRQAVQLGFLPRLTIRHTSAQEIGQVYVPAVNWALFAAVVALVIGFGSSASSPTAYGIAVTGTLLIDSVLFLVVVRDAVAQAAPGWSALGALALRHRRSAVPRRQRDQDRARRLVPAAWSASASSPSSPPGIVAARRSPQRASRPRGRFRSSSSGCAPASRRSRGSRGPRCTSTRRRTPRRSRCGWASSASTASPRRSSS